MFLGYIGKLLYEGEIERLKKELAKLPLSYDDIMIISRLLAAIDTQDELSLFYKVTQKEHEVDKEKRILELLERLEESLKLAKKLKAETDMQIASEEKKLIELLGAAVGFRFPGENEENEG